MKRNLTRRSLKTPHAARAAKREWARAGAGAASLRSERDPIDRIRQSAIEAAPAAPTRDRVPRRAAASTQALHPSRQRTILRIRPARRPTNERPFGVATLDEIRVGLW